MIRTYNSYKFLIFQFSILFIASLANAQDTTWVQGFNFNSLTRDSLIEFPIADHNQNEKILMYYTMRCKDGLVSTSTDRNKGCGEWDYSCNTNIIDSTGIDSIKTLHPNYIVQGLKENYFFYTTKPTFTYYSFAQDNVKINTASNVNYFPANTGALTDTTAINENTSHKVFFLIKASEINGLTAGNIAGISLNALATGTLNFLKIKLAPTTLTSLTVNDIGSINFQEVYNRDLTVMALGKNDLIFHKPFAWDGMQNMVFELSFEANNDNLDSLSFSLAYDNGKITSIENFEKDSYLVFNNKATLSIPTTKMSTIKNEITVSFWAKGSADLLPNDNSVLHARDSKKNRQLNVHLPWSNSRIYWDCGNDGSGFDRIDKAATANEYEGKWNHWAFTKNASIGTMKIYLNGKIWHSANGKTKKINITDFAIGSDNDFLQGYSGSIDDFAVWDKELSIDNINALMFQSPASIENLKPNLMAYYDFNEGKDNSLLDASGALATINGDPTWRSFRGADVFKAFTYAELRPQLSFIKGNYNLTTTKSTSIDSIQNDAVKVRPFSVKGTDLVEGPTEYYWAAGKYPIYDEGGNVIDEVEFAEESGFNIENLEYYRKFPANYELLSFVTPYGIGLDFGKNGKTWIFDVTDYGPLLKGKKRLLMDKGGEWQEDIDIKFAYIKGQPSRNVLSIQQIWPSTSYGYTSILDNSALEPKFYNIAANVKSMKIRTMSTGHGQQGEFIPRTHTLNINGGPIDFSWQLWKECANNVVYPQGGTWVYDRAGWCPGAPSDLREYEIAQYISVDGKISIDYGINAGEGDSRYIVNTQLVKYGANNFTNDAALSDIISPSNQYIYSRINPACSGPKIILKNNGSNPLKTADILYGIEGKTMKKYSWTGNLPYLSSTDIALPNLPYKELLQGGKFIALVEKPNNKTDEYSQNNQLESYFAPTRYLEGDIIVFMKTNGAPDETKWTLKDENGIIIKTSKTNLAPNKNYTDTIKGLVGCYQLQFTDFDDDGISWWANGDGNGSIGIKSSNTNMITFQPDFGKELTFNFTTALVNDVTAVDVNKHIVAYPNPANGRFTIDMQGYSNASEIEIYNNLGASLYNEKIEHTNPIQHTLEVNTMDFYPGLYFIQIKNQGIVKVIKLTKI